MVTAVSREGRPNNTGYSVRRQKRLMQVPESRVCGSKWVPKHAFLCIIILGDRLFLEIWSMCSDLAPLNRGILDNVLSSWPQMSLMGWVFSVYRFLTVFARPKVIAPFTLDRTLKSNHLLNDSKAGEKRRSPPPPPCLEILCTLKKEPLLPNDVDSYNLPFFTL